MEENKKNQENCDSFKLKGNKCYQNKEFLKAILFYNQSLCIAESNEQISLLYGNRSAVYFEIKRFKECLENIQLAKQYNYPEDKLVKLNNRENRCLDIIKNEKQIKEDPVSNFFKLSYKAHPKIPFIIDGVEAKYSEKYGRGLYTNKNLYAGDIIIIEEPFLKTLDDEFKHKRCNYCLKTNSYNLVPCENCTDAMFCSKSCQKKHIEESCKLSLCHSKQAAVIKNLINKGVKEFESFENFVKLFKSPKNISLLDFDEINYRNYLSVFCSLSKCHDDDEASAIFDLNDFDENLLSKFKDHEKITDCAFNIVEILRNNQMQVCDLGDESYRLEPIGRILCIFSSLFNHSCESNINRVWYEDKCVFYVTRPIRKDEQLFISYGPLFYCIPIQARLDKISQYGFKCDCKACLMNYPEYSSLSRIGIPFPKTTQNFKDAKSAIKEFKKNCELINEFSKFHPCYETVGLMWRNEDYISQIVRFGF